MATWTCTDDPCPWGDELSNPAIAWPEEAQPVHTRLGYTVSPGIYLPSSSANGITLTIDFGTVRVYAGEPQEGSHHRLANLSEGESFDVSGLGTDEVLSVQSDDPFGYHIAPTPPGDPVDAGVSDDAGAATDAGASGDAPDAGIDAPPPPDAAPVDAAIPPDGPATNSQAITWTCTGRQCPWGDTYTGHALVWQVERGAIPTHLGYTASANVYLFGTQANGADLWIDSGTVDLLAGLPGDIWPRTLTTLHGGDSFHVSGLAANEVVIAQSDAPFAYRVVVPPVGPAPGDPDAGGPGDVMAAVPALWRCNIPECFSDDWTGAVVSWPSWAAYQSNARPGNLSRSVFAWDDSPLYPYMGSWAEGCEVVGVSGITRVIEWQRGSGDWRDFWLFPGQSHVIHLISPEDGALLEGYDASPGFTAKLRNCTPQPLSP